MGGPLIRLPTPEVANPSAFDPAMQLKLQAFLQSPTAFTPIQLPAVVADSASPQFRPEPIAAGPVRLQSAALSPRPVPVAVANPAVPQGPFAIASPVALPRPTLPAPTIPAFAVSASPQSS